MFKIITFIIIGIHFFGSLAWSDEKEGIFFDQNDFEVAYGQYTQFTAHLKTSHKGQIEWDLGYYATQLPAGMESRVEGESFILFGTPQFQGKWCLAILAQVKLPQDPNYTYSKAVHYGEELCLNSKESSDTPHPKFITPRRLPSGKQAVFYQQEIEYDTTGFTNIKAEWINGDTQNIFDVIPQISDSKFIVSGVTAGLSRHFVFTLAIKGTHELTGEEMTTYKQYEFWLEIGPGGACPWGRKRGRDGKCPPHYPDR